MKKQKNNIKHPNHYNYCKYECLDIIEELNLPFHLGCAMKYLWRWNRKGEIKDNIEKAIFYLERFNKKIKRK